jgi:hypothetical protein
LRSEYGIGRRRVRRAAAGMAISSCTMSRLQQAAPIMTPERMAPAPAGSEPDGVVHE